ncbi:TRAM, LAG1 and CLN8 domain-protein [Podospora australis]|uniref:TRAM, LAG1 and CLN8 domain-protein n=1 Tax=Podospora australis TaxID=1536484 RepID=A0AAN6WTQ3_9PEZI|nr:TRAM, LAG1 and CLN8 domain-protein [Podospora australis]
MRDPFPIPPFPALSKAVEPLADLLAFPTLPLHVHEVVGAALFYTFTHAVISPVLSNLFFPKYYPKNHRAKKANWDAHVVSLIQSLVINGLALWTMYADEERSAMDFEQRVWGYTGASGMIQALACGYFVWDLGITLLNLDIFGLGLLAHAVSALTVYSFGFRPYLNYYSSIFILYELSTPFLNIHWFFDKLNMTGSKPQLYNGIALLATFFCCRLVWGTYQSAVVYKDMYQAIQRGPDAGYIAAAFKNSTAVDENVMYFAKDAGPVPLWLAGTYVLSNLTLNTLNWYWFFKMITAVKKRFEPPKAKIVTENSPSYAAVAKNATGADAGKEARVTRRRQPSIVDVVPDTEELRHGTIQ